MQYTKIAKLDFLLYWQVKEHLELFANIKGVKADLLDNVVSGMVDEVSS